MEFLEPNKDENVLGYAVRRERERERKRLRGRERKREREREEEREKKGVCVRETEKSSYQ